MEQVATQRPFEDPFDGKHDDQLTWGNAVQAQITGDPRVLIIIGLDDRARPHASRFLDVEAQRVRNAARLMGMQTLLVESEELHRLAETLPVGKLFASGKAFVPFVKQDLYQRLVAYLPIAKRPIPQLVSASDGKPLASEPAPGKPATANTYAAVKDGGKPRSGKYPDDWDKIVVGNLVLASAERDDGWWTAHVREVRADGSYVLEWEEWAGFDRFTCPRHRIALLHPDYDGK